MFEVAFSFQGRLTRLPYFLGAVALLLAYVVGLVAIAAGGVAAAAQHNWLVVVLLCLAVLPLAVAVLWCSLSLHIRRIRDIGWDPAIVITSWILFNVVDKVVLVRLLPMLVPRTAWHGTYIGLVIDCALSLAILFWPSQDDHRDAATPRAIETAYTPPPPPLPAPIPPRAARANGPVAFGRRGLR